VSAAIWGDFNIYRDMKNFLIQMLFNLRWVLLPLGLIHWGVIRLRNFLYDQNLFTSRSLSRPVISVGNIQMGGTGKTPLVIELIKALQQVGLQVGVLTRGYKRGAKDIRIVNLAHTGEQEDLPGAIGDEATLLLQHLSDGVLGVGGSRYEVGNKLLKTHPIDVFLLDDGFQHRQLRRDMDICLIDVSRWRRHPFLFPFSYLRDCRSSLRRADVIILTRFEQSARQLQAVEHFLATHFTGPAWKAQLMVTHLTRLDDAREIPPHRVKGRAVAAICGIGNPWHFYRMVKALGANLVWRQSFGDHHRFTAEEIRAAVQNARAAGAEWLLLTEKDAVKLEMLKKELGELVEKIRVVKIEFRLTEMPVLLEKILEIARRNEERN